MSFRVLFMDFKFSHTIVGVYSVYIIILKRAYKLCVEAGRILQCSIYDAFCLFLFVVMQT